MAAQRPNNGTPSASKDSSDESFENLLARLEEIVGQLEAGERPLEESLTLYEQGVATLKRCHVILDGADKRIRRLLQNSSGEPIVEDIALNTSGEGARKTRARPVSAQDSGQDYEAAVTPAEETEDSGKQDVDAEPSRPQNPQSSILKSRQKPMQGGKAGGSLFGSAQ